LIKEAQTCKSTGVIECFLEAYSFVVKFFDMPNHAMEHSVGQVKKFVEKVTVRNTNTRAAFGANEVRTLWEKLCNKYGSIENWSKLQIRSFMIILKSLLDVRKRIRPAMDHMYMCRNRVPVLEILIC
jgi:hypothetical protein